MIIVRYGNVAPVQTRREIVDEKHAEAEGLRVLDPLEDVKGKVEAEVRTELPVPESGEIVSESTVPDGVRMGEAVISMTRAYRSHHSNDVPSWVASNNDVMAQALASQFGDIPVKPFADTESLDEARTEEPA